VTLHLTFIITYLFGNGKYLTVSETLFSKSLQFFIHDYKKLQLNIYILQSEIRHQCCHSWTNLVRMGHIRSSWW